MSIMHHPYIWILTIGFKECNEKIILVNYVHNQMTWFRKRCGQSLVKVGQTQSNVIDSPKTTRLCEIQKSNLDHWDWKVWWHIGVGEIWEQLDGQIERTLPSSYTTYVHHVLSLGLKSNHWIQRV